MAEEITAEYELGQLVEAPPLNAIPWVTVACKTDLGRVRENNEDKFEYYIPAEDHVLALRGQIFLVCDGMGGHAAGQIASELACKTFIDVYLNHPATEPETALKAGVVAAHRYVSDVGRLVPARKGMGTTLSGLILLQDRYYVVQVGDSRVYRLRDGVLSQLTEDHTWVDEMIRMGRLTPKEAETHPYKHVLTRAIGGDMPVEPDIFSGSLQEDDVFLLCSDGLINHVSDESLQTHLANNAPSEACWKLVGAALQDGGSDNCTVMVIRVYKIEHRDPVA
jgi:protein phosphatase